MSLLHQVEYAQENIFFDGVNDELRKAENLRIRFYDNDQKAVITIKVRAQPGTIPLVSSNGLWLPATPNSAAVSSTIWPHMSPSSCCWTVSSPLG